MKKYVLFILFSAISILTAQDTKENSDFKLALSLYNDKLYDLAYEQFQRFIKQYPTTQQGIEAQFYLGLTQMKLKKYDEARNTFQNFALAYTEHSKAPEAWFNVAECYNALGKKQEAALAYERVKTFHPHSKQAPIALLRASELYQALADTENLRRTLTTLTKEYTSPETLPARLKLAELLVQGKQYNEAIQECRTVLSATNDQGLKAQSLFILSKALWSLGILSDAESALSEILTKYSNTQTYFDALLEHGVFHRSYGNIDAARTAWKKLLELQQAPSTLRQRAAIELAELYVRTQEYRTALQYYGKASEFSTPNRHYALFLAGSIAEYIGDTVASAQYYSRALSDSSLPATSQYAFIAAYKGAKYSKQYSEALRILQVYQNQLPSDPLLPQFFLDGASLAINELHTPHTAIDFCEWILRTAPQSSYADKALYTLGIAQRKLENYDAAIAAFDNLLIKYPSSKYSDSASYQKWYIETFEYHQKSSGIQRLASLIGDVIAQRPQGELAYRLGEIYFDDLRDYPRAAQQFERTLSLELSDTLKARSLFMAARSYELQALKEGLESTSGKRSILRAIQFYDSLLVLYPSSPFASLATRATLQYKIQRATHSEELQSLFTLLEKNLSIEGIDNVLLRLGEMYEKRKEYDQAVKTYKVIYQQFKKSPTYPTALYRLSSLFATSIGKRDSALVYLTQYVEQYPNHTYSAEATQLLIQYYLTENKLDRAQYYLTKVRERYSYALSPIDLQLLEARVYFRSRDFSRALSTYEATKEYLTSSQHLMLAYRPQLLEVLYSIAQCYDSLGSRSEAFKAYAEYITYDQNSERAARTYMTLTALARAARDVDRATFYLKQSAGVASKAGSPQSTIAFETAQLLFNAGKYEEAYTNYLEAQKQSKSDSLNLIIDGQLVCTLFRLDRLEEANKRAAEFQKKYAKSEDYIAQFEFERGSYFLRKEKYPVAVQYFDNVVKKYPKTSVVPEALYWKARIYEIDGKLKQAVALYDTIVQFYSKSSIIPKTRLSLGNAYYAMEQWEQAAQYYRTVLNTEDQSSELVPIAMSNLILTYKQMEMYDAALELTRKFIESYPADPNIIDKKIDIGLLYQKLGYYQQAIFHFQSLIVPGNNDLEAELRYYIGECYFLKGDYQQAVLEFLKVPYLVSKVGKVDWVATSYYMAGQSYEKLGSPEKAIQMYKQIVDRKESDAQFKTAARKEIDRVKTIMGIQ